MCRDTRRSLLPACTTAIIGCFWRVARLRLRLQRIHSARPTTPTTKRPERDTARGTTHEARPALSPAVMAAALSSARDAPPGAKGGSDGGGFGANPGGKGGSPGGTGGVGGGEGCGGEGDAMSIMAGGGGDGEGGGGEGCGGEGEGGGGEGEGGGGEGGPGGDEGGGERATTKRVEMRGMECRESPRSVARVESKMTLVSRSRILAASSALPAISVTVTRMSPADPPTTCIPIS